MRGCRLITCGKERRRAFYIDGEMIIDRIAQYNCGRVIRFLLTMARSLAHALEKVKWPKEVILLLTRDKAIELLQGKQEYLRREFGVSKIGIFGSVARDQSDKSSDVDIVVKFDRPIGFRFIELADYLEDLLGCKADILTLAGIEAIRSQNVAKSIKEDVIYV